MNLKYKKSFFILVGILSLSGLSIYACKEWFYITTDYGIRNNPLIDEIIFIHNFSSFFFLFILGVIYNGHVKKALKIKDLSRSKKRTGIMLLSMNFISALTGSFLFYLTNEVIKDIFELVHLWNGVAFVLILVLHYKFMKK
jgi:hypothetical protein